MSSFEQNKEQAARFLERFKDNVTGHYINGEWVIPEGSKTFENTSPFDQSSLGQIVEGTEADINAACEAARDAQAEWADMPGAERKKILHRFADKIVERDTTHHF